MTARLKAPESLVWYFKERKRRTAVDLLASSEKPPDDLLWSELRDWVKGRRFAEQVRYDYWLFLRSAWEAVWKPALVSALGDAGRTSDVLVAEYDGHWSIDSVWEFSRLYAWTEIGGRSTDRWLETGIYLPREPEEGQPPAILAVLWSDDDVLNSDDLPLGAEWNEDAWSYAGDGGWRRTKKSIPLREASSVDVAPLKRAARNAMSVIAEHSRATKKRAKK